MSFGAVGDGVTNDTAAFVAAEAVAGNGGKIYVPQAYYQVNNWTPTHNYLTVEGAGSGIAIGSTTLRASGSTWVATLSSRLHTKFVNITFDGNAKAAGGLRITTDGVTGSQGHTFDHCRFQQCTVGTKIEDGGAVNQADKNLYVNCHWNDNTTGFWDQAVNGQEQLLLGGSMDSHTTAVRLTHGTFTWMGGQIQVATTSFLIDGSNVGWLNLRDVITEGTTTDIDGTTAWPTLGVIAEHCTFQASTYIVNVGIAGSIFMSKGTQFNTGAIRFNASDAVWESRFDTLAFGAAWTLTGGGNHRRIMTDASGVHMYFGNAATPVSHMYVTGEVEGRGLATSTKAGAAVDGDFFFPVNGMIAVDSTNNRLYVRHGGAWHFVALT
jgi:hypothetical protein